MSFANREQIAHSLQRLIERYRAMITALEEPIAFFCREVGLDETTCLSPLPFSEAATAMAAIADPSVDFSRLAIAFHGRYCYLGNTLPLRFFARLARHPNRYVTYRQLIEDVWDGPRSNEAVRSVAHVLKRKLKEAGMEELANAIDGSNRGHFGLMLRQQK